MELAKNLLKAEIFVLSAKTQELDKRVTELLQEREELVEKAVQLQDAIKKLSED